jgi:hypothetical protein
MALIDMLLVLALLFFLFLPITDRRTVHLKLAMICTVLAMLTLSAAHTHMPQVQLAGVAQTR